MPVCVGWALAAHAVSGYLKRLLGGLTAPFSLESKVAYLG